MRPGAVFLSVAISSALVFAQTAPSGSIQASGNASILANPDEAQISVGVTTDGATAQAAAQANAAQTTTVINAIKNVLGASGTIQTIGYSVNPRYGSSQSVIGYTANNTVQVTINDLSLPGAVIDAASQAGATNVSGISFGLQNPDPVEQQALTAATKQAVAHAAAIAAGLGVHAGSVISAQQVSTYAPVAMPGVAAGASATPVQTGTVTVTASVTVTVQLSQ